MNENLKRALVRLGRAMLYGAIAAGITFLKGNLADFIPDVMIQAVVTAILLAVDKYARGHLQDTDTER